MTLEKEAVELLASRMDAFNNLWNLYITFVFAIFGFMTSAKKLLDRTSTAVIAPAFVAFAAVNWYGLNALVTQRWAIFWYYKATDKLGNTPGAFAPTTPTELLITHAAADLVVLAAILFLGLQKKR